MSIDRIRLQAALRHACALDVKAIKPGNVSLEAPGHGMNAVDFLASAEAIAVPITAPGLAVGERIYRAIEATRQTVNCNTNLGIVLLLAPLIQAAESMVDGASLERELDALLRGLTVTDADWAYRAIRLAKPGGMGAAAAHDIANAPAVTLNQAMQAAAHRDQIARLYSTGYGALFQRCLPVWRRAMERWRSEEWAATAVFLNTLANEPDSLIARKFGNVASEQVSAAAQPLWQALRTQRDPSALRTQLMLWDAALKAQGLNPGTTADITVATIFLALLIDSPLMPR